jgi:hypothetical protein
MGPGNLAHQHCPTILDNGNILVFDNGFHPGAFSWAYSTVLEVNPETNKIVWTYGSGRVACEFYTSILGCCQRLPNGNTLICEGVSGRIFEVNFHWDLVWEFSNNLPSDEPYPAQTRSHMVATAYRYGMDYSGLKNPIPLCIGKQPAPGVTVEKGAEALEARIKHLGY